MSDRPNGCKPFIVTKIVKLKAPETIRCCNCGCLVSPGPCHCGATNHWHFDPFEGLIPLGSYPPKEILVLEGENQKESDNE